MSTCTKCVCTCVCVGVCLCVQDIKALFEQCDEVIYSQFLVKMHGF